MYKDGVLTISDWQKGQAENVYLGFDTMRGVDIFSTPGIVKISEKTVLNNSTNGLVTAYIRDDLGSEYQLATNLDGTFCEVLKNGSIIAGGLAGFGWDMIFYKGYILVRHGSVLTAIETSSPSPTVFTAWQSGFSQVYYGKMLVSRNDGNVYIANGTNIQRLSNFVAGVPSVAPTVTRDTAVQMISGYACTTMEELGSRLMVGSQTTNSIWQTRYASTEAVIFPYRIGVSATNFDNPVVIANANCIQQMKTINNVLYIVAGMKGALYFSDGTSYREVRKIPCFIRDEIGAGVNFYPNAITVSGEGNLLIGTTSYLGGYFGDQVQHGIYEININSSGYESNLRYIPSHGVFDQNIQLSIGCVATRNTDTIYFGWQNGTTFGLDRTDSSKYTGYTATIESQAFRVGNKLNPKNFQNIEILLGRPLTLGQGIRVSYRTDTFSDYEQIGEWNFASQGSVISIRDKALMSNAELIQVKIEITTTTDFGVTPDQNIELLSVSLW